MPLDSKLVGLYRQQVGAAVRADRQRQVEDSEKKRAVVSAASYGEFRALVDTCHLKPLDSEAMAFQTQTVLNPYAAAAATARALSTTSGTTKDCCSSASANFLQIRSQAQLRKHWEAHAPDSDTQCRWLLKQSQEGLQRLFAVDMDPQLLLQLLRALARHLSGLAEQRCSRSCCCELGAAAPEVPASDRSADAAASQGADRVETAAETATAPPKRAAESEGSFCCRTAWRVSATAGFVSFLAQLPGTARGARLLLQQEVREVRVALQQALAGLHAPPGQAAQGPAETADAAAAACESRDRNWVSESAAVSRGTRGEISDGKALLQRLPRAADGGFDGDPEESCCPARAAVERLLRTLEGAALPPPPAKEADRRFF